MKTVAGILSAITILTFAVTSGLSATAATAEDLTITAYPQTAEASVNKCSAYASGTVDIPAVYGGYPVKSVAPNAFKNCAYITRVNVPASVEKVGVNAFDGCVSLETVSFAGEDCKIGSAAFARCEALKNFEPPSRLKKIEAGTFEDCASLETFTIPPETEIIGREAFKGCAAMKTVFIPASVKAASKNAFDGCLSISSFEVDPANEIYKSLDDCLYGPLVSEWDPYDAADPSKALIKYPPAKTESEFAVEAGTLSVAESAFGSAGNLFRVILPDGLKTIGNLAFFRCGKLSDINVPPTTTLIGSQAFARCPALKSITIPGSVSNFESAFYNSGLERVVIEEGAKAVGTRSFEGCAELSDVRLPESLETIGIGAFYNCSSLETLTVPPNVTFVGNKAFEGCPSLTLIVDEDSAAYRYAVQNGINYRLKLKRATGIEIVSPPDKTKYFYRENVDVTGLKIAVIYDDGSRKIVSEGYDYNPKVLKFTGEKDITVTYPDCPPAKFKVSVSYAWWQWIIRIFLLGFIWY